MGAGVIIRRRQDEKILSLIQWDGKFDLPKGGSDEGETLFETAQRETWEEASLWITEDQLLEELTGNKLVLYLVDWDGTPPKIQANPKTGEAEHMAWQWVSKERFLENCPNYLKPYINMLR